MQGVVKSDATMQPQTEGPDRGWSWVVAFSGFSMSFILSGIYRTSGVLMVAFINEFQCTREEASWPLVLCISVLNLTGIVAAPLSQVFGIRPVSVIGALVATVGISSCYFATSLIFIVFAFGIVFGIGFGLIITLMPVIVNRYFLKYRATASGIASCGSSFGSMFYPPLYEHLMSNYGLNGCFLLIGGVVLQTVVSAFLLRPPSWTDGPQGISSLASDKKEQLFAEQNSASMNVIYENTDVNLVSINRKISIISSATLESNVLNLSDSSNKRENSVNSDEICVDISFGNESRAGHPVNKSTKTGTQVEECVKPKTSDPPSGIYESFRRTIRTPMFLVTAVTNVGFLFLLHVYCVILVDFAVDNGVAKDKTKYIFLSFALSDFVGRLCFGWITDRKFIRRSQFVMLGMVAMSLLFFIYPSVYGFYWHVTASCLYGLLLGSTFVIYPILIADYVGLEMHAIATGLVSFLNGIGTLIWPSIIGYFRDNLGSYSNMFYVLGSISLSSSLLWMLEKCFVRHTYDVTSEKIH